MESSANEHSCVHLRHRPIFHPRSDLVGSIWDRHVVYIQKVLNIPSCFIKFYQGDFVFLDKTGVSDVDDPWLKNAHLDVVDYFMIHPVIVWKFVKLVVTKLPVGPGLAVDHVCIVELVKIPQVFLLFHIHGVVLFVNNLQVMPIHFHKHHFKGGLLVVDIVDTGDCWIVEEIFIVVDDQLRGVNEIWMVQAVAVPWIKVHSQMLQNRLLLVVFDHMCF